MTLRLELIDAATADTLRQPVLRPDAKTGSRIAAFDVPGALHVGAFDGDQLVGTAMVFPQRCPLRPAVEPAWQLRAMAVAVEAQGRGVGGEVLAFAVRLVDERGARLLWCNARSNAVPFYERRGFVAEGPWFRPADLAIDHRVMWLELPTESDGDTRAGTPT